MKLEVGMYVRTEKGIAKYLGLDKDVLTNDESKHFRYYANQHLFDKYIFEVGHDWGDTLSIEEFKNIDKYIEKEPSYNIIDLIETGGYVNGYKVSFKDNDYEKFVQCDYPVQCGTTNRYKFYENSIYSIVTKEQFESMSYKVGNQYVKDKR